MTVAVILSEHSEPKDLPRMCAAMYYVYILTNKSNTLYIGVTGNLTRRLHEHKQKYAEGFTKRYNINKLIYVEEYTDPKEAIAREKQLKGWNRKKKMQIIKTLNPTFQDLGRDPSF